MDLERLVKAAPIGLIMLIGSYLASRRRKSGQARAAQEFPGLAERLGLSLRAPSGPGRIGTLRGTHRSIDVFVDPDDRPRIVAYFSRAPAVILRTYEHEKRLPPGMVRVDLDRAFLDAFFKDRYAAPDTKDALVERSAELGARVRTIADDLGRNLAHLSVTSERIECALEFGRPAHIPADRVERLLPEIVELARFLEEAAPAAGGNEEPS